MYLSCQWCDFGHKVHYNLYVSKLCENYSRSLTWTSLSCKISIEMQWYRSNVSFSHNSSCCLVTGWLFLLVCTIMHQVINQYSLGCNGLNGSLASTLGSVKQKTKARNLNQRTKPRSFTRTKPESQARVFIRYERYDPSVPWKSGQPCLLIISLLHYSSSSHIHCLLTWFVLLTWGRFHPRNISHLPSKQLHLPNALQTSYLAFCLHIACYLHTSESRI